MENESTFDYIIIGAGAAGLMLADAMRKDSFFDNKAILLLDKDTKKNNDRTWCFWEKGTGIFDNLLYTSWKNIYFGGAEFSKQFNIAPYQYKMIRGIDFYEDVLSRITQCPNITFKVAEVLEVSDNGSKVAVVTKEVTYVSKQAFNSIFTYEMATHQKKYPVLQQHWLGWFVKTEKPVFNEGVATYMDFSIPQNGNTRFMYVLPFSRTEALVEYTLFSKELLSLETYEEALTTYLKEDLGCKEFEILDNEKGSIPMTCYEFREHHTENIRFIGTAGGWAKPSTGYTFMSTSKKIPVLIDYLKTGKPLKDLRFKNKFWYYDLLLLDVLAHDNGRGRIIFESLFKNRSPQLIFKFLDEETNFLEDIRYMAGAPWPPFTKALMRRLF